MPAARVPSRWKRLLYSIASVVLGALIASFAASIVQFWGLPRFDFRLVLLQTAITSLFTLIACFPGWLIALAFVLTVSDFSGWRFLAAWALGTAIGPLVVLGLSLFFFVRNPGPAALYYPADMAWFAVAIACLATLLYLLFVRYDRYRARLRLERNTPQPAPTPRNS